MSGKCPVPTLLANTQFRVLSNERNTKMSANGYPPKPTTNAEIWTYTGSGERLACALVGKCDTAQRMTYRKLRMALGEHLFREHLCDAMDILERSTTILTPAAWLYSFLKDEVEALGRE